MYYFITCYEHDYVQILFGGKILKMNFIHRDFEAFKRLHA